MVTIKSFFLINLLWMVGFLVNAQGRQTINYEGELYITGQPLKNSRITILASIVKNSTVGEVVYSEKQTVTTDSLGKYQIQIGGGVSSLGQFDSIIWSDGVFFLRTAIDPSAGNNYTVTKNILLRIPSDLNNDYEQGEVTASEHPDYGKWQFRNTRGKRPKLITIDLTTSYVNLAYPADTYPVYRHFEWCDPDTDGIGNSFMISYSDHTNNYFRESTKKLGEVKLYPIAFQELTINSTPGEISVEISKAVAVKNLSETYAIKGPWKFIYYFEW